MGRVWDGVGGVAGAGDDDGGDVLAPLLLGDADGGLGNGAQSDAGSGLAVLSVSARPSAAGNAPPGLVQSSSSPVGSST